MGFEIFKPALEEIILFNSFESLLYILMFLIIINKRISIKITIFHIFMLSIMNYVLSNYFNISILVQIINIIGISLYFTIMLKVKLIKSLFVSLKSFIFLFVLEMSIGIICQKFLHIEFISMNNNFDKFLFLLPVRAIEFVIIYVYYKINKLHVSYV